MRETKRVLVTVKAYPNPSKKYGETVCVAGIDLDTGKWIRLYPIPYRDLDNDRKFKKYNIIKARVKKASDDNRPESYKVDADSIEIIDYMDTKNNWKKRKQIVIPTVSESYCEILKENRLSNKSLGVFKPSNVKFIVNKKQELSKKERDNRKICYAQLSFYVKKKDTIEYIPYDFRYVFHCSGNPLCPGHNLPIIDWEIGQAYRTWRFRYKDESLLFKKLEEKWLDGMCSERHDTYFFVGNMKRFKENFMVLGVFYPRKE